MSRQDTFQSGYPDDFPKLKDTGGLGEGGYIKGFGGDVKKDKNGNSGNLKHTPVVFIHGNGASATGSAFSYFLDFSWDNMVKWLKQKGYNDSEIWAISYLGEPATVQINKAITSNIDDVRSFIDAAMEYLDVEKVDIIAHSLGCTLARGYLFGLQKDGTFDYDDSRFNNVGSLVLLSGGNYGLESNFFTSLSPFYDGDEFMPGSPIEAGLHSYEGFIDDTPHGSDDVDNQKIEGTAYPFENFSKEDYVGTSPLDTNQINYVSLWAEDDAIDIQQDKTGRLKGADLNKGYNFTKNPFLMGMDAHARILNSKEVFDDLFPYLNKYGVKRP